MSIRGVTSLENEAYLGIRLPNFLIDPDEFFEGKLVARFPVMCRGDANRLIPKSISMGVFISTRSLIASCLKNKLHVAWITLSANDIACIRGLRTSCNPLSEKCADRSDDLVEISFPIDESRRLSSESSLFVKSSATAIPLRHHGRLFGVMPNKNDKFVC